MKFLHVLAVVCFLVFGATSLGNYERGLAPAWEALLVAFGGALLPYAVALTIYAMGLLFVLSIAPPNFYEMWQEYRRSRNKRGP